MKKGRVCAQHEQWCPEGDCPYCEQVVKPPPPATTWPTMTSAIVTALPGVLYTGGYIYTMIPGSSWWWSS